MDDTRQGKAPSARERARDEIKTSQDRLRPVIDAIPAMVWSALPDGTIDFVNRVWVEYHGRCLDEVRTEGLAPLVHPQDCANTFARWREALAEGEPFEVEFRAHRADGEYRWFLSRAVPLRDESGQIVKWYGTSTDIEDRMRAERLLAGENRLLEMIARHEPTPLILGTLCRLVEDLAGGCLCSILLLDHNRLRHGAAPSLPAEYSEAIDGLEIGPSAGSCGTAAHRAEPVVVADIATDPLWIDFRDLASAHGLRACWSQPILSSNAEVLGTFATYSREPRRPTPGELGITEQIAHLASIALERERAEERLRKAQAHLAHFSRVTTMGELTAALAHEVNQPIAGAVTNANACLRWLSGDVPNLDEARAAAVRIVKDGTRAAEIISRIRLAFRKGTPQRNPVDVNEIIRGLIVLLRNETTRSSISVRAKLAPDLPRVRGDPAQLQQVMMNLIVNAIEAMEDLDGPRDLVLQSGRADNEQVLVSVSDTGVGLPPQRDQIFEALFTTKPQGIGMGLSISRSIVEAHGGRLWTADRAPRGATFSLTLPVQI